MRHDLISIGDLSDAGIEGLFDLAVEFAGCPRQRLSLARDAVMATLFYEPSTRTRMSFEAAMLRLGGQVISMADPGASSAAKGETLSDTMRIMESYADVVVLRHPREGAARLAADFANVPVINAGDGAREHPTQTLLDLYTIRQEKGRIAGMTVALCGDLKHGRTVHSLVQGLARFGANLVCVAPPGLELPATMAHAPCRHYASLDEAPLHECDVLYVTRIQRERFSDPAEFARVRSSYQVSRKTLERAHPEAIVLHPLPRVDELDFALDGDPRAAYFRQAAYGLPVRMALVAALLGLRSIPGLYAEVADRQPLTELTATCGNARCIRNAEAGVPSRFTVRADGACCCAYCELALEGVMA